MTLVTRLSAILADIVVLVATLLKTWSTYRESLRAGLNVPIASLLIRDGKLHDIRGCIETEPDCSTIFQVLHTLRLLSITTERLSFD